MKKILFFCFITSLILVQPAFAQKKNKKDRQTTTSATTSTHTSTTKGMKKDGTPDMRYKKNTEAAEIKTVTPPVVNTTTTSTTTHVSKSTRPKQQTTTVPVNNIPVTRSTPIQGQNTSADRAIGTDAKGRTIYEGKRGGHYYVDSKGNRVYVKE